MKSFGNQGVLYSDQHFSEDTLAWLFQAPDQTTIEALPPDQPVQHTPDSAFAAAWAELSADPELMSSITRAGYSQDKGRDELNHAIAAQLAPGAFGQVTGAAKIDYVATLEGGRFVHRLNGDVVLSIPPNAQGASVASLRAEAAMNAVFVVFDVISIVVAAMGVTVAVKKEPLVKQLQTPLQKFLRVFVTTSVAADVDKLKKVEDRLELVTKIVRSLHGSGTSFKDLFKIYLQSFTPIQIAIAVLQVVAGVLLLLGTAGGAVAKKVFDLAVAVTFFITDVGSFVLAVQRLPKT